MLKPVIYGVPESLTGTSLLSAKLETSLGEVDLAWPIRRMELEFVAGMASHGDGYE
jgi:hypothetical protein